MDTSELDRRIAEQNARLEARPDPKPEPVDVAAKEVVAPPKREPVPAIPLPPFAEGWSVLKQWDVRVEIQVHKSPDGTEARRVWRISRGDGFLITDVEPTDLIASLFVSIAEVIAEMGGVFRQQIAQAARGVLGKFGEIERGLRLMAMTRAKQLKDAGGGNA